MAKARIFERGTPRGIDLSAVNALRHALDAAGYRAERIRPTVLAAERGERRDALATLIRLFFLRLPVAEAEAVAALQPLGLREAAAMGIARQIGDSAIGLLELAPIGDSLFASDGDVTEPQSDHVMSPAGSSRLLAALTPRRPVDTALDLGTGCGYQAILAARHAKHVVATDVNPRAVAYAAFNATLNGVSNLQCALGDWESALEPGRLFDLVVCNPPYVIAPSSSVIYREDPLASGGSSSHLVRAVPNLLAPFGVGVILVGWTHAVDQHWADPLLAWLDRRCDAWLLHRSSADPSTYAATWNAHLSADRRLYVDALQRWTAFFAEQGVERLAEGAVALRRRSTVGRSHVRYAELPQDELDASAADDLARRMELSAQLEDLDDAAFGSLRLSVAPEQRLEQILRYRDVRFHLERAVLVGETGLRSRFYCDGLMLRLLGAIDGQRPVDQIVEAVAAAEVTPRALVLLREAVAHGALRLD